MRRRVRDTYEAIEKAMNNIGRDAENEKVAKDIAHAVRSIKFGYIQVIIQDSKIVQIDKTEKIRLDVRPKEIGGGV